MDGENVTTVVVETAPETPPVVEAVVESTTETIIDTAIVIADKIDEARQEGQEESKEVIYTLEFIAIAIGQLTSELAEIKGLIEYLTDEVATLTALEVAEVVVENPPDKVEEIAEVATVVGNTPPEVPEAPQVRENKKARKYL